MHAEGEPEGSAEGADPVDLPRPRRRFGQNFLTDRRLVERLVDAFAPETGEPVIEVGPGRGALTRPLLDRGARVTALEIDRDLVVALEASLGGHPGFRVIEGDALVADLDALAAETAEGGRRLRLVANLPYNVATAILRRVLAAHRYRAAQVLVQDEVADRLTAGPSEEGYGPLAVLCALRGGARRLFRIGPAAFRPRPKVVSAAVALRLDEPAPLAPADVPPLEALLRSSFAARRKTLANNLRAGGVDRERVERILEALGLAPAVRPEELAPQTWLALRSRLAED
jgi:16S rRNA (adenine1518-N6/adenine1519-N6)-dimethyltransferase